MCSIFCNLNGQRVFVTADIGIALIAFKQVFHTSYEAILCSFLRLSARIARTVYYLQNAKIVKLCVPIFRLKIKLTNY